MTDIKTIVNTNLKLKTSGGVLNSTTDGLSVDTGTTDGKIVQMTTGDKLPAVDGSNLTGIPTYMYYVTASNNLHDSSDTERTSTAASLTLLKQFLILKSGTYRVSADIKAGGTPEADVGYKIYKNGVAAGDLHTNQGTNYKTFTDDLYFAIGDYCQLYATKGGGGSDTCVIRNFRLYYDETLETGNVLVTD